EAGEAGAAAGEDLGAHDGVAAARVVQGERDVGGLAGEDLRAGWELLGQVDRGRIGPRRVHGDGDGHALDLAAGKCDVGQGADIGAAQAPAGLEAARHRQPRAQGDLVGYGVADAYRGVGGLRPRPGTTGGDGERGGRLRGYGE